MWSLTLPSLAHKPAPARSPAGGHPIAATLKVHVEALQGPKRAQADRLMAELLRATADTPAAKEAVARLKGEQAGARPWWCRGLKRRFQMEAKLPVHHPCGRVGFNRGCALKSLDASWVAFFRSQAARESKVEQMLTPEPESCRLLPPALPRAILTNRAAALNCV